MCGIMGKVVSNLRFLSPPESLPYRGLRKLEYDFLSPLFRVLHFEAFVRPEDRKRLYLPEVFREIKNARAEYEDSLLREIPLPRSPLNQILSLDYRHYFAHDLLVKMDIASMNYSLEARSPLLDHILMEFAARLPEDMKVRGKTGKYLLKRLAERYLPRDIIHRPKQGFSIPVGEWMRNHFAPYLEEMLVDSANPLWNFCRCRTVSQWLEEHLERKFDHGYRLWVILILGLWLKKRL